VSANGSSADLVFVNGAVYTVDAARRWAQAVAVKRGRIEAVGTDADVKELVGARTEIVDLDGKMLVPGFQDAHVHPPSGGLEMLQCNLNEGNSIGEYVRIIRTYADAHPDEEWILGGGWSMDAFPGGTPTKDVLDAEANLTQARENLTGARSDFQSALTGLWKSTGELLDRHGVRIDGNAIASRSRKGTP